MRKLDKILLAVLLLPLACHQRQTVNERNNPITEIQEPQDTVLIPAQDPAEQTWSYQEDPRNIVNPGRGFYSWNAADTDKGLALIRVVLTNYCAAESLDDSVLNDVASRLESLRKIPGKQAIVRVIYADDGVVNPCGLAEAARPDIAIKHLQQLAPIFRQHRQDIAFFEAGFYGMWGEWNSEYAPKNTRGYAEDPQLRFKLVRALLDQLPDDFLIMLRRPRFRAELEKLISVQDMKRLAFHNDCYLASATDMGTYDGDRTPDEWKDHIGALSRQGQAIGGETCADEPVYTNCETALQDMKRLGMTYLNTGWNPAVIQRWKDERCFEHIATHLGYRNILTKAQATLTSAKSLQLDLAIDNEGFAPAYQNFQPQIFLTDVAGKVYDLKINAVNAMDPRNWLPGQAVQASLIADTADIPTGTYEVHMRWRYFDRSMRLAVQNIWNDLTQSHVLGVVVL